MNAAKTRFSYLAWAVLVFTVLTVLGGAVVRATGSGDQANDTARDGEPCASLSLDENGEKLPASCWE